MNKYEWFGKLNDKLYGVSEEEKKKALEYYEELYNDKREGGLGEDEILSEFGSPEAVARKIREDSGAEADFETEKEFEAPAKEADEPKHKFVFTAGTDDEEEKTVFGRLFSPLLVLGCVIYFLLAGTLLHRWATAWMVFLLIPILESARVAIKKRNPNSFAYPVLAVLIFLMIGMYAGVWHPTWIIFLTIPIYHTIFGTISANKKTSSSGKEQTKKEKTHRWMVAGIICSILSILILVGGVFAIIGAVNGAWKTGNYNFNKIDKTETIVVTDGNVTSVNIESNIFNVVVRPCDEKDITVGYIEKQSFNYAITAELNGTVATIKAKAEGANVWFQKLMGINDYFILVKIPVGLTTDLNVNADACDVLVQGDKVNDKSVAYKNVGVELSSGSVYISDLNANSIKCDGFSGSKNLTNVTANEVNVKNTSGTVSLNLVKANNVRLEGSSGTIKAYETESQELFVKNTSGTVKLEVKADVIDVNVTSGSVKGKIKGKEAEYNVLTSTTSGSCNLTNKVVEGSGKSFKATVTSGSISVEFTE